MYAGDTVTVTEQVQRISSQADAAAATSSWCHDLPGASKKLAVNLDTLRAERMLPRQLISDISSCFHVSSASLATYWCCSFLLLNRMLGALWLFSHYQNFVRLTCISPVTADMGKVAHIP